MRKSYIPAFKASVALAVFREVRTLELSSRCDVSSTLSTNIVAQFPNPFLNTA